MSEDLYVWERIGVSIVVLLLSFAIQKLLSFLSRNQLAGGRWGREDYLLWHDWLASGLIALFAFLIKGNGGTPIGPVQLYALAFVVLLNLGVPALINALGYEPNPPHTLLAWRGILIPNLLAALTVGVAVAVGVDFSN